MNNKLSRRTFLGLALVAGASLVGCTLPKTTASVSPDEEDYYRATPLQPDELDGSILERSEQEWRELLTPFQFRVMREKGTERAFTGEYDNHKAEGTYHCSACGNPLFSSDTKYDSGTGWPSFWASISEDYVKEEEDRALGMVRTEVLCARCESHLGHVFNDGPEPTGLRYCMNSIALNFSPIKSSGVLPKQRRSVEENQGGMMIASEAQSNEKLLYDFSSEDTSGRWVIVNDGVMGGLSQSQISLSDAGTAIFQGTLSLENFGGFASVRTVPYPYDLEGYEGLSLRVRGDGRLYKLRLRVNRNFDGPAYEAEFDTTPDTWTTISLPFQEAVPKFRGRRLTNVPALDGKQVTQIGLMLADKQSGPFKLEVDWIRAYGPKV